jgi:hypothetical protein
VGEAAKTSHGSAHRGPADGQCLDWIRGDFTASGRKLAPPAASVTLPAPQKEATLAFKRRRKMIRVRSPRRKLGHPRVRKTLFIILPHFGWAVYP